MALDWIPRTSKETVREQWFGDPQYLGTLDKPPSVVYEKRPLRNPETLEEIEGLYTGWIIINNEAQGNSYTIDMLKGLITATSMAAQDKSVVVVILTGVGNRFFCTGGNVPEYAEYFVGRGFDTYMYTQLYFTYQMNLLSMPKLTIRRINGICLEGGEELSICCDLTVSSDLATFGVVGPLHGSAPLAGILQLRPLMWGFEDGLYNATSTEQWSAYKLLRKNYIHMVVPVLKQGDEFIRNPEVITDRWVDEKGRIVYGEWKEGEEREKARELVKTLPRDLSLLDKEIEKIVWQYTNLFPGSLSMSLNMVREWKKFWLLLHRDSLAHWWNAPLFGEYDMGMTSFYTRKQTGKDRIDFIKYRQLIAKGHPLDQELYEEVMPKPTGEGK